jgi:hypothetical protein
MVPLRQSLFIVLNQLDGHVFIAQALIKLFGANAFSYMNLKRFLFSLAGLVEIPCGY